MNDHLKEIRAGLERLRAHHADMARRANAGTLQARHDHRMAGVYAARLAAFDRAVEALRLALPEQCEDLRCVIEGGPIDEDGIADLIEPKLVAVRAVAAALGEELPAELVAMLPDLPASNEEGAES